jgi:2'-hydroxyisoflavone reductase
MRLLIIGGTRFLGRHLAHQALAAGHAVTLLHRGRSGPGLFAQAEHRLADRNDPQALAAALAHGEWDGVIDTSAYFPRQVRQLATALQGRAARYQLVSTISVYAAYPDGGNSEDGALATLDDPAIEEVRGDTYGGLKVLCEQAAAECFGATNTLVARPGLIVGPFDPSGRFCWWLARLQRGGEVLAPGRPEAPAQVIDARDLAAWMLVQAAAGTSGIFNLTGPGAPLSMGTMLETVRATLRPDATLHWVDERFVLDHDIAPWSDLPVWLPAEQEGLHRTHIARALATGLVTRPLAETVADTAAWMRDASGGGLLPNAGLAPEREAEVLAAWKQQQPGAGVSAA